MKLPLLLGLDTAGREKHDGDEKNDGGPAHPG